VNAPLDELYFQWLYGQVADPNVEDPSKTYWDILRRLFTKEFVWFVPYDGNRIEDGKDLRQEFIAECTLGHVELSWLRIGCSMLELMIGLSRRLSFVAEGEPLSWFWRLMENIDLLGYNDAHRIPKSQVDNILNRVIWRTYDYNGEGGLFPLAYSTEDQRKVELWKQLNAYVLERF